VQQNQVMALYTFMTDYYSAGVFEGCTTTCGLSNVSNGPPEHLRPILNQTYLIMIKRYGMASAIVDVFDTDLHKFARGEHPEVEQLVYKVCDGEDIDVSSLSKEEGDYVKTARVLLGQSLYSDSWLEL
jgi:5-methyltetrahydrofolate corrinoid/iron sulfur protein methyltransferase